MYLINRKNNNNDAFTGSGHSSVKHAKFSQQSVLSLSEPRKLAQISPSFLILLALFLVLISTIAQAGRVITSLPHYEDFNDNSYVSELVFITQGATHSYRAAEGWTGGAARFTPPTSEGYSGLGSFTGLRDHNGDLRRLNVRILIKHGPEYHDNAGTNKLMIFNRESMDGTTNRAERRPMIITTAPNGLAWQTYRPCHNTWCYPEDVPSNEPLQFGNNINNIRSDEWVSIELEADLDAGVINIYVYTDDGEVSGLYATNPFIDPNDPLTGVFSYIDIIGGYFNYDNNLNAATGNYFLIDELVIDDEYIGPPTNFLQFSKPPTELTTD